MPTFTNEPDSDLYKVLGEKQAWKGAGLKRKTSMSADLSGAYRGGSKGACSPYGGERLTERDLASPTNIPTPNAPSDDVITEIHSRGNVGFSEAGWKDVFGPPSKPGRC